MVDPSFQSSMTVLCTVSLVRLYPGDLPPRTYISPAASLMAGLGPGSTGRLIRSRRDLTACGAGGRYGPYMSTISWEVQFSWPVSSSCPGRPGPNPPQDPFGNHLESDGGEAFFELAVLGEAPEYRSLKDMVEIRDLCDLEVGIPAALKRVADGGEILFREVHTVLAPG